VARTEGLRIETHTRLLGAERQDDEIRCRIEQRNGERTICCERLVLATGYFDHPKPVGVPGEDAPHVSHYFDEAHKSFGQDVVVIGGRNSACEAALDLFRAGARVTLIYRGTEFPKGVKYWLRPDIENRIKADEIRAHMGAEILRIEPNAVTFRDANGQQGAVAADRVYALTGFRPDFDLFRGMGIELDRETGVPTLDSETLETNVPGIHMVGSTMTGWNTSDVFIENGRYDGEKVFGDSKSRENAKELYRQAIRYYGE